MEGGELRERKRTVRARKRLTSWAGFCAVVSGGGRGRLPYIDRCRCALLVSTGGKYAGLNVQPYYGLFGVKGKAIESRCTIGILIDASFSHVIYFLQ